MKICLIIDDYMPDSTKAAARMMHDLAIEFKEQGHSVSVVTPNPYISTKVDTLILDDIKIYRFKTGHIKNVGKVQRAINETLLSYKAWNSCKDLLLANKHDIIIYYSPTIFFGSFVKKLKKVWDAPSYLILRDIFPRWAIDSGLLREKSMITKYFQYFESLNYQSADKIGLMSPKNLELFNKIYELNSKTEVLYNWASNDLIETKDKTYKKRYNLENKVVFFYGGNIGHAQDMINIVRLAHSMKNDSRAHFMLVGQGDEFTIVEEGIKEYNLNNMTLLPAVSQEEFMMMLSEYDVGLFTLHKAHSTHNFPGKILAYMTQGIPILGSINVANDVKEIIENAGAGLISSNGDDTIFLKNAQTLMNDDIRQLMGKKSKKLLTDIFSVQTASTQILHTLGFMQNKN